MSEQTKKAIGKTPVFTGVKMNGELYRKARLRARQMHLDYSNYVRQLIVHDLEKKAA